MKSFFVVAMAFMAQCGHAFVLPACGAGRVAGSVGLTARANNMAAVAPLSAAAKKAAAGKEEEVGNALRTVFSLLGW